MLLFVWRAASPSSAAAARIGRLSLHPLLQPRTQTLILIPSRALHPEGSHSHHFDLPSPLLLLRFPILPLLRCNLPSPMASPHLSSFRPSPRPCSLQKRVFSQNLNPKPTPFAAAPPRLSTPTTNPPSLAEHRPEQHLRASSVATRSVPCLVPNLGAAGPALGASASGFVGGSGSGSGSWIRQASYGTRREGYSEGSRRRKFGEPKGPPRDKKPLPVRPLSALKIKRRKDVPLDRVIERSKKLRIVNKVKELLCKQEGRVMTVRQLGKHRRDIGLIGKRRCIVLLRKFPAVFEIFDEGKGHVWFRLTRAAEAQVEAEATIRKEMEHLLVDKIRKLLMMATNGQIRVQHLVHMRRDLGLPDDFRRSLLPRFPQFFQVRDVTGQEVLELTERDENLAVSAMERKMRLAEDEEEENASQRLDGKSFRAAEKKPGEQETEADEVVSSWDGSYDGQKKVSDGKEAEAGQGEALSGEQLALAALEAGRKKAGAGTFGLGNDPKRAARKKRVSLNLPKGLQLPRAALVQLQKIHDMPYISPYSDPSEVEPGSMAAEKRWVAVIHEILSMTVEKRILIDHLTHLRMEFKLTQRLKGFLVRHPEYFYVSEKGVRDSVFLREAYDGDRLIEKDPLAEAIERLRSMVLAGKRAQNVEMLLEDGQEALGGVGGKGQNDKSRRSDVRNDESDDDEDDEDDDEEEQMEETEEDDDGDWSDEDEWDDEDDEDEDEEEKQRGDNDKNFQDRGTFVEAKMNGMGQGRGTWRMENAAVQPIGGSFGASRSIHSVRKIETAKGEVYWIDENGRPSLSRRFWRKTQEERIASQPKEKW